MEGQTNPPFLMLGALLDEIEKDGARRHTARSEGRAFGPVTGVEPIDELYGHGMEAGLHLLNGTTSVGKTAMACQIAASCGEHQTLAFFWIASAAIALAWSVTHAPKPGASSIDFILPLTPSSRTGVCPGDFLLGFYGARRETLTLRAAWPHRGRRVAVLMKAGSSIST